MIIELNCIEIDIGQYYFCKYCPKLQNLAKFDKSNVARAKFFFGLSMVPLLKSASPISIFSGLGVDGLSFFSLGQYLQK